MLHVSCHMLPVLVSNPQQTSELQESVFISINRSVNKAQSRVRTLQQILSTTNTDDEIRSSVLVVVEKNDDPV